MQFILNPSFNFSPFGVTPRSQFALLMVGVFAFRLAQWRASSYLLLALAALFHQSSGAMAVLTLLAIDVVLRSDELVRRRTFVAVLFTVAVAYFRPNTLAASDAAATVLATSAVAILLICPWVVVRYADYLSWWPSRQDSVRRWAVSPLADIGLIGLGLVITLPIVWQFRRVVSSDDWLLLWSQLHGRLIAIVRPAMFLAAAWWTSTKVTGKIVGWDSPDAMRVVLVIVATLLSPTAAQAVKVVPGRHALAGALYPIERVLLTPAAPTRIRSEMVVYYAIAKTLDLGEDWTWRLFADARE